LPVVVEATWEHSTVVGEEEAMVEPSCDLHHILDGHEGSTLVVLNEETVILCCVLVIIGSPWGIDIPLFYLNSSVINKPVRIRVC
jgi:hypothetical protein